MNIYFLRMLQTLMSPTIDTHDHFKIIITILWIDDTKNSYIKIIATKYIFNPYICYL